MPKNKIQQVYFYFKTPCQLVSINFIFFVYVTAATAAKEIIFFCFNVLRLNEVEGKNDENKKK